MPLSVYARTMLRGVERSAERLLLQRLHPVDELLGSNRPAMPRLVYACGTLITP